ncbi:MAG TPA: ion channel [Actinomycetota bacterium]|nr:ion channel [Actinomycetota bacterium]
MGTGEVDPGHHRPRRGPVRRLAEAMVSPDSYGSVLVLLVVTYAVSVALTETWARSLVLLMQIATVWLALHVSRARRPVRYLASAAFVLAATIAVANILWGTEGDLSTAIVFYTSALLYFIAPLSILRAIVTQREVTLETLLGAIDAYLLIGMFFAFLYLGTGAADGDPFFAGGVDDTLPDSLFFSFTTLTTTGYGNLVPAGNPGQAFAVVEMLIGQLFLITAVAKVINAWRPTRWRIGEPESRDAEGSDGGPPSSEGGPP